MVCNPWHLAAVQALPPLLLSVPDCLFVCVRWEVPDNLFMVMSRDAVVVRLFPVGRGLYEDKVASIWCAVDPVLKMKAWPNKGLVVLIAYV